jgi:hypothetical protein
MRGEEPRGMVITAPAACDTRTTCCVFLSIKASHSCCLLLRFFCFFSYVRAAFINFYHTSSQVAYYRRRTVFMTEITQAGTLCHLCAGHIPPTDWFYFCQTCSSVKPKLPHQFCLKCAAIPHGHPSVLRRKCACPIRKMDSFAASVLNRFTAFAERTIMSFPSEPFPFSPSPFCGGVPARCSLTYGQVRPPRQQRPRYFG